MSYSFLKYHRIWSSPAQPIYKCYIPASKDNDAHKIQAKCFVIVNQFYTTQAHSKNYYIHRSDYGRCNESVLPLKKLLSRSKRDELHYSLYHPTKSNQLSQNSDSSTNGFVLANLCLLPRTHRQGCALSNLSLLCDNSLQLKNWIE